MPLLRILVVFAQAPPPPPVNVNPTTDGLPGAALFEKLLNWLSQGALWGSLASLLIGAGIWGLSQHAGNSYGAGRGRNLALAGVVGALLAGLSPTIVNTLFSAAR
jgi:hypothetical protein